MSLSPLPLASDYYIRVNCLECNASYRSARIHRCNSSHHCIWYWQFGNILRMCGMPSDTPIRMPIFRSLDRFVVRRIELWTNNVRHTNIIPNFIDYSINLESWIKYPELRHKLLRQAINRKQREYFSAWFSTDTLTTRDETYIECDAFSRQWAFLYGHELMIMTSKNVSCTGLKNKLFTAVHRDGHTIFISHFMVNWYIFLLQKCEIGQFVDAKKAISFLCMALVRHPNTLAIELEYIFGCQRLERIHRCNSTRWGILRERWSMVRPVHCILIDNLDHNQGISRSVGISRWSYFHHLHKYVNMKKEYWIQARHLPAQSATSETDNQMSDEMFIIALFSLWGVQVRKWHFIPSWKSLSISIYCICKLIPFWTGDVWPIVALRAFIERET